MSKSDTNASRTDDLLLVNAYVDGELDAAAVLDLERRIGEDPVLKEQHDRIVALRTAIREQVPKYTASEALREKIYAIARQGERTTSETQWLKRRAGHFNSRQMAASILVAAVLASGVTALALRSTVMENDIGAIVSGHQRALLAATAVDVASSDRHTVKPWFDSKVAISPPVVDLASSGFPLIGGRLDVISGRPLPTLVYKRHEHLISLVSVPAKDGAASNGPLSTDSRQGYSLLSWRSQDFTYYAISDVSLDELTAFVAKWRAEASK